MVDFTNEVIVSDDYLFSDLIKCCEFFISENSLYKGNSIIGNEIWDLPVIAEVLVENEANKNIIKNIFETICIFEKSIPSSGIKYIHHLLDEGNISSREVRGRSSFIFNQVFKLIRCDTSEKLLKLIKKQGNPSLTININRAPVGKPIIKFSNLPNIKIKIAEGFVPKKNSFTDCHFFMIDGAVSNSSELSFLLNKSFENKQKTYFLVCKSFNEEVLNTLKQNYYRNTINVVPLQYGFDLETINTLPDLVSVVGGLPISPLLGDLINNVDTNRMGYCDECKISGENIIIKSNLDNSIHRKRIAEKIDVTENQEKKDLLSQRLAGLTSNSCKITLPNGSSHNNIEKNILHAILLLREFFQNPIHEYKFRKQKFYVSKNALKIQNELDYKISDLLKTKIFLPRRKNG